MSFISISGCCLTVVKVDQRPVNALQTAGEGKDAEEEGNRRAEHLCDVCQMGARKYTCPACGLRSCSLPCTKDHKAASGERAGLQPGLVQVWRHTLGVCEV